jgi:hypothetical protein
VHDPPKRSKAHRPHNAREHKPNHRREEATLNQLAKPWDHEAENRCHDICETAPTDCALRHAASKFERLVAPLLNPLENIA